MLTYRTDARRRGKRRAQANAKVTEGRQHPDRDAQFRYINDQAKDHQAAGGPVISVDAKKKENVGQFKQAGRTWRPKGQPQTVQVHDFIDKDKVTPYGVYDIGANSGWVSVGTDYDTAAFAVSTIRTWSGGRRSGGTPTPEPAGCWSPPTAVAPTGTAPSCGRPSWPASPARPAWRSPSATSRPAAPGSSKWNKIEHVGGQA